jgi:Nuclease-related domain
MKLNFQGRVSNVVLPNYRALLPVFEALINSQHAIEDAKRKDGVITLHIQRDRRQERQPLLIGSGLSSRRIVGFTVEDNGVGFNKENYESFDTSDSDHKKSRGAKGVGRFMWLKAFDSVHVASVFRDNGSFYNRSFDFSLAEDGISNPKISPETASDSKTIIELRSFNDRYEQECPRTAETIAERIIEHCLSAFMNPSCPKYFLRDDDEKGVIILNELYRKEIEAQSKHSNIKCHGVDLAINHVRVFAGEFSQHIIHLCANGRDVQHITLSAHIPYVPSKFKSAEGKHFVYKAYVSSPFLDQRVNAERTAFNLARDGDIQSQHEPTEKALIDAVVQAAEIEIGPLLTDVEDRIKQRIEDLVGKKYPEYRPILKEIDTYIKEFREGAEDEEILAKLNEIQFREDLKAREEVKKLLSEKDENVKGSKRYKDLQVMYLEKAHEIAQSRLAQCVIHRKIILDLLEAQVSCKEDKFPKEEKIHEIIFPMRKTSDEVSAEKQNLWIIDERLAYHRFLASDKPIRAFSSNDGAGDEPDLFILNHPGVFVASEQKPINSAVIVEFKRAEREHFKENPVQQVYRYVNKLRNQEITDDRGRKIHVHTNAVFYCYIIADLTPAMRTIAEESTLILAPDQLGYFGFNPNYKAYIEIISYDKLLKDSHERNRELFKALGLDV